jgi:probable phosphoglycerate mutase
MTVTIFFVRHGQTAWNAQKRYQGQTDIPLNDTGRQQARGNGRALRRLIGANANLDFIASPLSRARETMELVREELGLPREDYATDARLIEVSYGEWEGRTYPQLLEEEPGNMARRAADNWNFIPPGGESYRQMSQRIDGWRRGVRRDCVVVAHGGVMRLLQVLASGEGRSGVLGLPVPQDRIMILRAGKVEWA